MFSKDELFDCCLNLFGTSVGDTKQLLTKQSSEKNILRKSAQILWLTTMTCFGVASWVITCSLLQNPEFRSNAPTIVISGAIKLITQTTSSSFLILHSLLFRNSLKKLVANLLIVRRSGKYSYFKSNKSKYTGILFLWSSVALFLIIVLTELFVDDYCDIGFIITFLLVVAHFGITSLYTFVIHSMYEQFSRPIDVMVRTICTWTLTQESVREAVKTWKRSPTQKKIGTLPLNTRAKILKKYRHYFLFLRNHMKQQNNHFTPAVIAIIFNSTLVIIAQAFFFCVSMDPKNKTVLQTSALIISLLQLWMTCMVGQDLEFAVSLHANLF